MMTCVRGYIQVSTSKACIQVKERFEMLVLISQDNPGLLTDSLG